jgi:hypothetical protein
MFKIILIILIILLILCIYRNETFTDEADKPFVYAFNNRFKDDIDTRQ